MQKIMNNLILGIFILILVATFVSSAQSELCIYKFTSVAILTNEEGYQIGEPISGIKLKVTGNVPLNLPYDIFLYKDTLNKTVPDDSIRGGRMSNGTADINFGYIPTAPGKFIILLKAGNNGEIVENKTIEVKKTFDLKLFCPIANNFINSEVSCSWTPTDIQTKQVIAIRVPIAKVTQGEVEINSPILGNVLRFTPTISGSVIVRVEAEAEGYVKDIDEVTVSIQDATYKQTLLIDSKDFYLLSEQGIDVGTRSLELKITKGLLKAEVGSIKGVIVTPSGQENTVTFVKSGDIWKTTYNFQQPGQKYILRGSIEFSDINIQPIPFNYDILTLKATSEKEKSITTSIIIYASVAILVVIGIIIFIIFMRRKKK